MNFDNALALVGKVARQMTSDVGQSARKLSDWSFLSSHCLLHNNL